MRTQKKIDFMRGIDDQRSWEELIISNTQKNFNTNRIGREELSRTQPARTAANKTIGNSRPF